MVEEEGVGWEGDEEDGRPVRGGEGGAGGADLDGLGAVHDSGGDAGCRSSASEPRSPDQAAAEAEKRATARRKKVQHANLQPGQSYLQLHSVTPLTRQAYEESLLNFQSFVDENGLETTEPEDIDYGLVTS